MRARASRCLLIPLVLGACSPSSEPTLDLDRWTVSTEPATVVGQLEGDSVYLFQRIDDARLLPDGRIVVADAGLAVIRIYDPDGRFLAQMGGRGGGPGEFAALTDLWTVAPDTIGVLDLETYRLTRFLADGSLVNTLSLEPSMEASGIGRLDLLVGRLADGSLALGSITTGEPGDGGAQDRISIERFGADGAHIERIAEVAGFIRGPTGPGPFSPYPYFDVRGDAIYFTNGEDPTVRVWEGGTGPGAEWSARTIDFPPVEHDPDAAWAAIRSAVSARDDPMARGLVERAIRTDSLPHLAGLVVDEDRHVWAKRYETPGDAMLLDGGPRVRGGAWWVAAGNGRLVAVASVPDGLIPLHVAGDAMLGMTVDELGIERIQVHRIDREGRDGVQP